MTNRERAEQVCGRLYYDVEGLIHGGEPMAHEDNLVEIERALDQAHKEGTELGYDMGQREMRERAAYLVTNWEGKIIPMIDAIRALPVEGE